jgi:hypothetical protein
MKLGTFLLKLGGDFTLVDRQRRLHVPPWAFKGPTRATLWISAFFPGDNQPIRIFKETIFLTHWPADDVLVQTSAGFLKASWTLH